MSCVWISLGTVEHQAPLLLCLPRSGVYPLSGKIVIMTEARAKKWEILSFIEDRDIVTAYDLMERFLFTYRYAYKKLNSLKNQGLVKDMGNTPSTCRGQWCLTSTGSARLHYLCRKLGVLTDRERREWREWFDGEEKKAWRERRTWYVEERGVRMIKVGERGVSLSEALEIQKLNRELGGN